MRWAELRMCRFWAGGISSFPFSRAREYRLLRRLPVIRSSYFLKYDAQIAANGVSGVYIFQKISGGHAPGPPEDDSRLRRSFARPLTRRWLRHCLGVRGSAYLRVIRMSFVSVSYYMCELSLTSIGLNCVCVHNFVPFGRP